MTIILIGVAITVLGIIIGLIDLALFNTSYLPKRRDRFIWILQYIAMGCWFIGGLVIIIAIIILMLQGI